MAIIVSDTSAIRALHHLNRLDLISRLYGQLFIPPAVHAELILPLPRYASIDLVSTGKATVRHPTQPFVARVGTFNLDPGEVEAIALALEIHADFLLIDERRGRSAAQTLGLPFVGALGVLLEAKRRGFEPQVAPLFKKLRIELGFFIHPQFEQSILASVGETPLP